jgi:hypothetical protein
VKGATLETIRAKIAELQADARATADACFPAEHVKARAAALVESLARPVNVRAALETDGDLYLPLARYTFQRNPVMPGCVACVRP